MHSKQTNLLSKGDKLKYCISQLHQAKHGNITVTKLIRLFKRNNYNLIKYVEQETGYDGEEIMKELSALQAIQEFESHTRLHYPLRHPDSPLRDDFFPSCRSNFNCRYQIASCPHTQRIQQEMKQGMNEVQLDEQLVDGFTNELLSYDLIQIIMRYYCIKWVILPEDKANYLISHYRECLNWIKQNKSISYARFYEIELMPALIDRSYVNSWAALEAAHKRYIMCVRNTQERINGYSKRNRINGYIKRNTIKVPKRTIKLPNRYKYFVKTKRNNIPKQYR